MEYLSTCMKTGLFFAVTGALSLVLLFFLLRGWMQFTPSTVDLHLFDTYLVITYVHFILFIVLVLGTFFSLGRTVATRFNNKYFLGLLLVFALADVVVACLAL